MGIFFRYLFLILYLVMMVVSPVLSRNCSASSADAGGGLPELMNQELAGMNGSFRKNLLLDYETTVNQKNEVSLHDVGNGENLASRAIVRDKSALVLHQLRRIVGEEDFIQASKIAAAESRSAPLSWDGLKKLLEHETGKDLSWFFQQWIDRKGLPDLHVENTAVRRNGSKFEVSFDLLQEGDVYTLDVPVSIPFLHGGGKADTVITDVAKKRVTLFVDDEPKTVVIDGDYDVPRKLTEAETPPVLAKILSTERPLLITPAASDQRYDRLVEQWKQRGAEERRAENVSEQDMSASNLVLLGENNPVVSRLYGKSEPRNGDLLLEARKNPWNPNAIVVIAEAKNAQVADETLPMLIKSGECSELTIDMSGRVNQRTAEAEKGIRIELREEPLAADVSTLTALSPIIDNAAGKKIVYVGEYHDRFAHHDVELQVIKSLYRKNPQIAIGMEMFQRPYQQALDDYVSGTIDERAFLKKSEYFKRWSFDYNLYKPIIDFARAEKIPLVALNLRSEITDKVSREGMGGLTAVEKQEIPSETDFSDSDYRERLKQVFAEHKGSSERNFDYFYQAQILWDETMAMSIDEYLKKNPDRQMVVLAGQGHLAYGSGIPRRAFRRNGLAYVTILNDAAVDRDIAQYIVVPQPIGGVTAPKLMVFLNESRGRVIITDMPEDSVSRKAGLKIGDRIVSLDGAVVQTIDDLKIALFYKKQGETITVNALRSRFLLGDQELTIRVKLP